MYVFGVCFLIRGVLRGNVRGIKFIKNLELLL